MDQNIQYKLSMLSIFKNETMNLKVWLEHYIFQGVEKFYLIDNDSNDNPLSILQPYIDRGIVDYIFKPEKHKQVEHYKSTIIEKNIKKTTKWLVICDLDEFYYGYPDILYNTVDRYEMYDIIYSNWKLFGSSGYIKHPEDIRKSLLYREPNLNKDTKYIVQIQNIDIHSIDVHYIHNNNKYIIENNNIKLNHYPIQSLEYFTKVKMTRGDVATYISDNVRDMDYFNRYDSKATYKDEELMSIVQKIELFLI